MLGCRSKWQRVLGERQAQQAPHLATHTSRRGCGERYQTGNICGHWAVQDGEQWWPPRGQGRHTELWPAPRCKGTEGQGARHTHTTHTHTHHTHTHPQCGSRTVVEKQTELKMHSHSSSTEEQEKEEEAIGDVLKRHCSPPTTLDLWLGLSRE